MSQDELGGKEIGDGPECCQCGGFTWRGGIQVRPGRGNERPRTVRQDENQIELAVAPHPAKQRQCLAFQRVAGSNHGDRSRIALEVGSVLPFRSTRSILTLYSNWSAGE